ncbi:DUF6512 family protein [Paludicola sp. MB14-C6]|uniref:DUF6512 family protein n=1 Tax=Paludihabitans sp. MB14-C6 TaxID=3070656 RepID=UPI0027DB4F9F|nr:DUF6512 family protein [Paludicola sp. MB14-C6]WMJ22257.1 DUF6512 family protein [Paludicola sp. MB14-C6]
MENKKRILLFEIIGAIVIVIGAFLFHFLYELSGDNFIVGLFVATNESVFQHIKIVFVPFVLYSIIEYFCLNISFKKFFTAKSIAGLSVYALLIIFYYTYSGIIGYNIALIDIFSVFLYALISAYLGYRLLVTKRDITKWFWIVFPLYILALISLIVFTIWPPKINLFYDTMYKTYYPLKHK